MVFTPMNRPAGIVISAGSLHLIRFDGLLIVPELFEEFE
jgi:hypothetical protein